VNKRVSALRSVITLLGGCVLLAVPARAQQAAGEATTPEAAAVPLFPLISEGHHVVGACAFSDQTYAESVAHLAAGRVPVERLVSERVTLDETPDALRRLQTPGSLVRIISRPNA